MAWQKRRCFLGIGVTLLCLQLFSLSAAAADVKGDASIVLDKEEYVQGDRISVTFQAPEEWARDAWVGIVSAAAPHGRETLDVKQTTHQYLEKRSVGVMVFKAPAPGEWEARLYDAARNGREAAVVRFTTTPDPTAGDAKIFLKKNVFAPGERIDVSFTTPRNWQANAWIGIVPSAVPHGSEEVNDRYDIAYRYIEERTHGWMIFVAPEAGQWDLRMNDSDDNGREAAAVSFTVR